MTLVIGLTGGIASGKSTVSNMIRDWGYPIIDADIIAKEAVDPGKPALEKIIKAFGRDILKGDGSLDRQKLGGIIFQNAAKREILNSIVHPAVREEMLKKRDEAKSNGEKAVVLDIPLLFESKLAHFADVTLLVFTDDEVQLKRLMERNGYTEEEAAMRISSQMPLTEKKKLADAVIDNNGTLLETKEQLQDLFRMWNI
ncbi:dephospho-CoA kinase [Metabacillus sp. RGM 3146]|uniref:dephospho-CoA kinase n=1 Tax=Metabacillus sp. RGM 3146 TaxID=3401092 RepID=UPI003B9D6C15